MEIAALLAQIVGMVPVVTNLVNTLDSIKKATEKDHPEVWAKVSADWQSTKAQWDKLQGGTGDIG